MGSEETRYFYENGHLLLELNGDSRITGKTVRGHRLIARETLLDTYGFIQDGHGDVTGLVSPAGELVLDYAYDPFGNETTAQTDYAATWDNPFRCCGEYWDGETQTYYLRARQYDPAAGRFLSEDTHWNPANAVYGDTPRQLIERTYAPDIHAIIQSGNLHVYCMGNPVNYVDFEGELAYPGQIHNLVVNHVAAKHGYYREQRINYSIGWGRADLISKDGQIWDVKRDNDRQINAGKRQVLRYVANKWKNAPSEDFELTVGGYIEPDSFEVTLDVDTYYVKYRYAGDGIIAYDYDKVTDWEKVIERTIGIVIVVGGTYAVAQSGGSLAPAFAPVIAKVAGG